MQKQNIKDVPLVFTEKMKKLSVDVNVNIKVYNYVKVKTL